VTCTGTAQVGASLVAPLGFIFKRSSLRFSHDMINNSVTYIMILKKEKKDIDYKERKKDYIAKDATVRTPKVRLHTRPVCYLALCRGALTVICVKEYLALYREVLAVIFVKHKSMMIVIRVHVYTAVCACHTHVTRDIGAHESMITIPTPSSKTTSW